MHIVALLVTSDLALLYSLLIRIVAFLYPSKKNQNANFVSWSLMKVSIIWRGDGEVSEGERWTVRGESWRVGGERCEARGDGGGADVSGGRWDVSGERLELEGEG